MNRSSAEKNFFAVFSASLIGVLSLAGCTGAPAPKAAEPNAEAPDGRRSEPGQQAVPVVAVEKQLLDTQMDLPGQLVAYQDVPLHAKVQGYVSWIGVDRGSIVHKGQLLVVITAPEVDAQVKEAEAELSATDASYKEALAAYQVVENKLAEAKARLEADTLTFNRLAQAAKTPGAIAQNEVDLADKAAEQDRARAEALKSELAAAANVVASRKNNVTASQHVVSAVQAMRAYLQIKAPFDGVITERNVHLGSIVSVSPGRDDEVLPMLRIQQKDLLRLVVAVPEACVEGTKIGQLVSFTVPAFPGREFVGRVARPGFSLDLKTRTMPVEMDVANASGELQPGMFATVKWTVSRQQKTLFAPASAVADDLKGTFVIRVKNGFAERVPVSRGQPMLNQVEVIGNLKAGDLVALKATDELKTGSHLVARLADESEIEGASRHASVGGE